MQTVFFQLVDLALVSRFWLPFGFLFEAVYDFLKAWMDFLLNVMLCWDDTWSCQEVFLLIIYSVFSVVILVPTRELALQTSQVCKELGKHLQIQVMVTTGGTSLKDDIMRLYQPVHLLVGTPGRILDLAKKGVCVLKDCSMLIMDEVCNKWFFSIALIFQLRNRVRLRRTGFKEFSGTFTFIWHILEKCSLK